MSNSPLFSNLPRFDDAPAHKVTLPFGMAEFDAESGAAAPKPAPLPEPEPEVVAEAEVDEEQPVEAMPEPAPAPAVPTGPDLAMVEQTTAELQATIARIELEAAQQVTAAIEEMAHQLFPKLASRFLAGEIGLHLRDLVPVSVASVEIQAAPAMADALADMVDGMPELSQHCTILPREMGEETAVEVSWRTGGLSFDFAGLLASCLARLGPKQSETGG
jgi:hypothetical protein